MEKWLAALTKPLRKLAVGVIGTEGADGSSQEERDVRELTQLGQEEGLVGEDEHLLVERAFRLDELTAWDVMTPRVDIFAWSDSLTLEKIIGELKSVPYSRVPVYKDTTDDISGILYVREAYENYVAGRTTMTLSQLARDPLFVPGSLPLTRLLHQFQARRIHMGIIADEFGGTDGLATLEDVLEELVGEIVDETDVDEEALIRISRTQVIAPGGVDVREINYAFNVALPQLEHRSLNGFILEELGHVPEPGETGEASGREDRDPDSFRHPGPDGPPHQARPGGPERIGIASGAFEHGDPPPLPRQANHEWPIRRLSRPMRCSSVTLRSRKIRASGSALC